MIFYEGPSQLDGSDIVGIITTNSRNIKTGPVLQSWILNATKPPTEENSDLGICGDCPIKSACYVTKFQAPLNVYKTYKKGGYKQLNKRRLRNQILRLGAYGDPAAIPVSVWKDLTKYTVEHIGYTHQWKTCDPEFKTLCQASTESIALTKEAHKLGWKTFRIKDQTEEIQKNEVLCLNESKGYTCQQCGLCNGTKANITITVHGAKYKINNFKLTQTKNTIGATNGNN